MMDCSPSVSISFTLAGVPYHGQGSELRSNVYRLNVRTEQPTLPNCIILKVQSPGEHGLGLFQTEIEAYERLRKLQGRLVPVLYGEAVSSLGRAMILSIAPGEELGRCNLKDINQIKALARVALEEIEKVGVHHNDMQLGNFFWNGEIFTVIDWNNATFDEIGSEKLRARIEAYIWELNMRLDQDNEILYSSCTRRPTKPFRKKAKIPSKLPGHAAKTCLQKLQKRQRSDLNILGDEEIFEDRDSDKDGNRRSKRFQRIEIGPERTIKKPESSKAPAQSSEHSLISAPLRCPTYSKQSNEPV